MTNSTIDSLLEYQKQKSKTIQNKIYMASNDIADLLIERMGKCEAHFDINSIPDTKLWKLAKLLSDLDNENYFWITEHKQFGDLFGCVLDGDDDATPELIREMKKITIKHYEVEMERLINHEISELKVQNQE